MADVIELKGTRTDGKTVFVHACGTCGMTAYDAVAAERCCRPAVCACGATIEGRGYTACKACRDNTQWQRDRKIYDAAKKTPHGQYAGAHLCCDCCDKFYADVEELLDDHEDRESLPTWAWACTEDRLAISANDVLDGALESQEWFEDAHEWIPGDLSELQAALDKAAAEIPPCFRSDHAEVVTFEDVAERREAAGALGQEVPRG